MKPFPIYLVGLDKRHCVVLGGGDEAEFKVSQLLDVDANLTVIADTLTDELYDHVEAGRVKWIDRDYRRGDLKDAWLVIAEQHGPEVDEMIAEEAEQEKALLTLLDNIPHCNAVQGSLIRRGPLVISMSTSGAAPALAVRLRQRFEKEFGDDYAVFLSWMQTLRPKMKQRFPKFSQRKAVWYELIDSDALLHIRNGHLDLARQTIGDITGIDPTVIQCSPGCCSLTDCQLRKQTDVVGRQESRIVVGRPVAA